jgi:Cu2+-exporting ATPase
VAKAAEDSLLSDIVRLMEKAGQGHARYVRIAEKAAALYTPVVHMAALLAFLLWWVVLHAAWQDALMVAVTVLIITCPCALGLAVPVVQVLATGRLMKAGILVKSGDALERIAAIDTVMLDKTGTLTLGHPRLKDRESADAGDLSLAAALAAHSSHPLCKALADAAVPAQGLSEIREHAGQGMEALWQGKNVRLGSRTWCGRDKAGEDALMELWLSVEGRAPAVFRFEDALRPDAKEIVGKLRQGGLDIMLLSGDRAPVVAAAAAAAGIQNCAGGKTPVEKYDILEKRKKAGARILMVGDGLNDAPVLAGADVSMSPSTAIDMAQNAADIIFMGDGLAPVYIAWRTGIFAQRLVKQNFILAVVYNALAVPLAVAGFVTPLVAAIAMSSSSIIVIANSFRLRGLK